ncbi:MAG: peroxiredoxin [Bacteroidota bacterium]
MPLQVGQKAPDFTLVDIEKKERSLKEFLGKKIVLVFYPGAFTGVCTKEMCSFRDALANFNGMNAQVVGISVDGPFANKGFSNQNNINFPLLSDFTRTVSKQYAGLYESFSGVSGYTAAKRAVFVLDPQGITRYAWISENPGVEPPYDEVKAAVAKA